VPVVHLDPAQIVVVRLDIAVHDPDQVVDHLGRGARVLRGNAVVHNNLPCGLQVVEVLHNEVVQERQHGEPVWRRLHAEVHAMGRDDLHELVPQLLVVVRVVLENGQLRDDATLEVVERLAVGPRDADLVAQLTQQHGQLVAVADRPGEHEPREVVLVRLAALALDVDLGVVAARVEELGDTLVVEAGLDPLQVVRDGLLLRVVGQLAGDQLVELLRLCGDGGGRERTQLLDRVPRLGGTVRGVAGDVQAQLQENAVEGGLEAILVLLVRDPLGGDQVARCVHDELPRVLLNGIEQAHDELLERHAGVAQPLHRVEALLGLFHDSGVFRQPVETEPQRDGVVVVRAPLGGGTDALAVGRRREYETGAVLETILLLGHAIRVHGHEHPQVTVVGGPHEELVLERAVLCHQDLQLLLQLVVDAVSGVVGLDGVQVDLGHFAYSSVDAVRDRYGLGSGPIRHRWSSNIHRFP
jgi:hypothetical protein